MIIILIIILLDNNMTQLGYSIMANNNSQILWVIFALCYHKHRLGLKTTINIHNQLTSLNFNISVLVISVGIIPC